MRFLELSCLFIFVDLLAFSSVERTQGEEKYFTPQNVYRFANHLFSERDYLRAAGEFKRYFFLNDSIPSNADSVFFKIGLCYRFIEDIPKSVKYFRKIVEDYPESDYKSDAYYQIALAYSIAGEYPKCNNFIESFIFEIKQENLRRKTEQILGINYLQQRQWSTAENYLENLSKRYSDSLTLSLLNFAKEGQQLPHKSPFMAGLFSSIIPGSGKFYCGRKEDGIFSLITIALTGWQSYEGFQENGTRSIKGWTLGTLCTLLYLGNIYGSSVAAQLYNEQKEIELTTKIKLSINAKF